MIAALATAANFMVCLDKASHENGIDRADVPRGALFQQWGSDAGDLRANKKDVPWSMRLTDHKVQQWVVLITRPVRLTRSSPCAKTDAVSLVSDGWSSAPTPVRAVPRQLYELDFAPGYGVSRKNRPVDDLIALGVVVGQPLSDITRAVICNDVNTCLK